jgi:hypothetical protein
MRPVAIGLKRGIQRAQPRCENNQITGIGSGSISVGDRCRSAPSRLSKTIQTRAWVKTILTSELSTVGACAWKAAGESGRMA